MHPSLDEIPRVYCGDLQSLADIDINHLNIVAKLDDDFEYAEYLAFHPNISLFILKVKREEYSPIFRLIKEFYYPNFEVIDALHCLSRDGYSSSEFLRLLENLWSARELFFPLDASILNINLKTLAPQQLSEEVSELAYVKVGSLVKKPVFVIEGEGTRLRYHNLSLASHSLIEELIKLKKQIYRTPEMESIKALNFAGSDFLRLLSNSLEMNNSKETVKEALFEQIEGSEDAYSYEFEHDQFEPNYIECWEIEHEKLLELYFEDKTGLATKLVNKQRELDDWEMLGLIMDSSNSSQYVEQAMEIIQTFAKSANFQSLKVYLDSIKSRINSDLNYQLTNRLIDVDDWCS